MRKRRQSQLRCKCWGGPWCKSPLPAALLAVSLPVSRLSHEEKREPCPERGCPQAPSGTLAAARPAPSVQT